MREDNLVERRNPGLALWLEDTLTAVLQRAGALLEEAVEAEVAEVIARYRALWDERGRQKFVMSVFGVDSGIAFALGEQVCEDLAS